MSSSCKIYLAGEGIASWLYNSNSKSEYLSITRRANRLKSFFYVGKNDLERPLDWKSFMLDSGAYTFAYGSKAQVNMTEYFDSYKEYIKENDVDLFFELDIDELVGYDKVLEYRRELEHFTGKQCIPVWHVNRGKEEWLRMCDEYDYVAIGGLAAKEFKSPEKFIPWFTKTAHERGAKVHGLGYTKLPNLLKMGFDSVDSSAWLAGNLGGFIYQYKGGLHMDKVSAPSGKKLNSRNAARHNFMQWVMLSEYLDKQ